MANSSSAFTTGVSGTFDSTGASTALDIAAGEEMDVSVDFDTNSFVGTIQLQRQTLTGASGIGEYQTIESYSASAEKVALSSSARSYRLNCSVATSGTAEFEIAGKG